MRVFCTWMMIVWVMTGLNARVMGGDFHSVQLEDHSCCESHPTAASSGQTEDGQDSSPVEPHHHHDCSCLHGLPLSIEGDLFCRLPVPGFRLVGIGGESEIAPEKPCLMREKPPLI